MFFEHRTEYLTLASDTLSGTTHHWFADLMLTFNPIWYTMAGLGRRRFG